MTEERVSLERLTQVPNNVGEATVYQVLGLHTGRQLILANTNTKTGGRISTNTNTITKYKKKVNCRRA